MFICGVIYIIISIGNPKILNIILAIFWTLSGVAYFIPTLAPGESSVTIGEGFVKVKWMNWLRYRMIQDLDIEKITVARGDILIDRKNDKQIRLPVDFFELDQKKEAYNYFIELSKQKSYPLEKIGFGQE